MDSSTASRYVLRLYIAGQTPRSMMAVATVRRICEEELEGNYTLEIVDVFEQPQLAEDEKIIATPTLVKQLPPPLRRVIGDLSDVEKILVGLDLHSVSSGREHR